MYCSRLGDTDIMMMKVQLYKYYQSKFNELPPRKMGYRTTQQRLWYPAKVKYTVLELRRSAFIASETCNETASLSPTIIYKSAT